MTSKSKILIGSCNTENVQRICSKLKNSADFTIAECWEEFLSRINQESYSIQVTDLNMTDCFPSVVLDNIQEQKNRSPVIILLEDIGGYTLYRERAHLLIEILPIEIVDDDRFVSTIVAAQAKYDLLKSLL